MTTISMDKQYTTRDGKPVRLLCVDKPGDYPVVGVIDEHVVLWGPQGEYLLSIGLGHEKDLIEAKPRVQCEVWVYRRVDGFLDVRDTPLSRECVVYFGLTPLARIPIDVEEGHGLEGGE